jgi:hypothetical protein
MLARFGLRIRDSRLWELTEMGCLTGFPGPTDKEPTPWIAELRDRREPSKEVKMPGPE